MKTYKIVHTETLVGWFYVDAETPEVALEEYHNQVSNGVIDFSDLEMIDSEDKVEEDDVMTLAERMAMIDNKVEKEVAKAERERIERENKIAACIYSIKALKPRIDDLITLANYAKAKGIKFNISGWGGHEGYDTGMFYTNCWSHLVGFVDEKPQIRHIGIYAGGACGSINFLTDGNDVIGYDTRTKTIVEPVLSHMEAFLKRFDIFESEFYAYIEKRCQ